jgi:predicted DCC family thiol-disulfide oxidoreductase YuxK
MNGTLFFDGACGMCTRSRDFLLKLDRTGNVQTEPLQSPGVAERLGITPASLLDSVRWLDSSGAVYSGAHSAQR